MHQRPHAFLFDMDGLLLDTERVSLAVALDISGRLGIDPGEAEPFFVSLVGGAGPETRGALEAFLGGAGVLEQFWGEWGRSIQSRYNEGVPVKATVVETLTHLSAQDARMAVVTSTHGARARHHLERAGLLEHFEHVLGGDEVSATKPHPAPYLEAAEALGVKAQDCVAFEDSDRGITAAVAAGCRAVQIPDLRAHHVPLPDLGQHVAQDLASAMRELGLL